MKPPEICFELKNLPKSSTPPIVYQQSFARLLSEKYLAHTRLYTDGSKKTTGVGAAAICNSRTTKATLPKEASIFSAETHALLLAVSIIQKTPGHSFVIFTDSNSALSAMLNYLNPHPSIRKLLHQIDSVKTTKNIEFCWIPSHVGIKGNENADVAANEAANGMEAHSTIFYQDLYPTIDRQILNEWRNRWNSANQKLHEVKSNPDPIPPLPSNKRRDHVVMNRLRAGHCRFSHGYLMDSTGPRTVPICSFCNNSIMSVKHVLIQCPNLINTRHLSFPSLSQNEFNLNKVLSNDLSSELLDFLRRTELYAEI